MSGILFFYWLTLFLKSDILRKLSYNRKDMKMKMEKKVPMRLICILSHQFRRKIEAISFRGIYSGAQGRALHFIIAQRDKDVFQKDIEEEFALRPPTASELLKTMEKKGLITRQPVEYDARLKKIVLTDTGAQCADQVLEDLDKIDRQLEQGISKEDMEVFYRVLEKMIDNLS